MAKTGVISPSLRTEPHSAQSANSQPEPNDAFVELHDFVFDDGETLASLKLHYLTLGTPRRDASGAIANGVLLLHGTAGSAADLAQAAFFDALYGAGEPLDLSRYFLVIPDAIGAGDSSKPSDGLQASGSDDRDEQRHNILDAASYELFVCTIVVVWYVWPSPNQTFSQFCSNSAALCACASLCGNDFIGYGYDRSETAQRVPFQCCLR